MLLQIFLILILFIVLTYQSREHFRVTGNIVIDGKKSNDETIPPEKLIDSNNQKKCLEHQAELDLLVSNQVISPSDADKILTDINCKRNSPESQEEGTLQ